MVFFSRNAFLPFLCRQRVGRSLFTRGEGGMFLGKGAREDSNANLLLEMRLDRDATSPININYQIYTTSK